MEMNEFDADVQSRLINLGKKLKLAEKHVKLTRPLNLDDRITNADLQARYNELLDQVRREESSEMSHRLVGELEYSIKLWLAGLDNGS